MKKLLIGIFIILFPAVGCRNNNTKIIKEHIIGNTYNCKLISDDEGDFDNYELEFINDSVVIMSFEDDKIYVQSNRWELKSNLFEVNLIYKSNTETNEAIFKELNNGEGFQMKFGNAKVICSKIKNKINTNINSLIGKWQFLEFGFPRGFDSITGELKEVFPTYEFKNDNTFQIILFDRQSKGYWSLNNNNSMILLNDALHDRDIIRIIETTKDKLILSHRDEMGDMNEIELSKN